MPEVMSSLNMKLITTAAESPFQNELCVHAVTCMLLNQMKKNVKIDSQTLLCWANMVHNSMQTWYIFGSHQIVFGQNPNLSGIMTDKLPVLDEIANSEPFVQHLNAVHEARKAYIQTESNRRVKRTLRTKVRAAEQISETGEAVFSN